MADDQQQNSSDDPRDRRIAELEALVDELRAEIAQLREENDRLRKENAELRRRLNRDSSNSSRPPSSDSPSSKQDRQGKTPSPNNPGKQPGAPGHHRDRLEPDKIVEVVPDSCRNCGEGLSGFEDDPHIHQVVDLPPIEPTVVDYRLHRLCCPCCGEMTKASLPDEVPETTYGPRISALASTLVGHFRMSRRLVVEFFETVCHLDISLGTVSNHEATVTEALEEPYQKAKEAVVEHSSIFVDETGWSIENGLPAWLWAAARDPTVVFMIHLQRSSEALKELVGDYGGIIHSDRYSSYTRRDAELRQHCWAHLDRNFKGLASRDDLVGAYGEALQEVSSLVLGLWRSQKTGFVDLSDGQLKALADEVLRPRLRQLCEAGLQLEDAPGIFENLLEDEEALWHFVDRDDVERTNNLSERSLRPGVIWRKLCFGSNSKRGERFVERMLTAAQTLKKAKQSLFDFVYDCLLAHRLGQPMPSLLPSS